ncbi:MAG: sulfotransferase domain-containing protein [Rhizomicrobium sp.]
MSGLVWLASYPKSGNTWFRLLLSNLAGQGETDINDPNEDMSVASARYPFDDITMLDSSLLTPDEVDLLRPSVFETIAGGDYRDYSASREIANGPWPRIMKVHDAYTRNADGRPLLGAAQGAIVIVRDPRAVAPSLANHLGCSIDAAIETLGSENNVFGGVSGRLGVQLRQKLLSWSSHVASWLDQSDVPVHLVRYEALKADTPGVLRAALAFAGRDITPAEAGQAARLADFARLQAQERAKGFREWTSPHGGLFFRRGEAEAWREELSPPQIARIEADHAAMMRRLGYKFLQQGGMGG